MKGRSILAVLGGIMAGGFVIYLVQSVIHMIYPIDEETLSKFKDYKYFEEFMMTRPVGMYLLVMISHALGEFSGMMVSRIIDRKNAMPMFITALILLLGNVLNFLVIPHPSWFAFGDLGMSLGVALGYGGYVWGKYRKA